MSEYEEPTQIDYLMGHIEALKQDVEQFRAENDKLRGQVEGLKECIGFAMLLVAAPTIHRDNLRIVGKKIMEGRDVDELLALWWKTFERKSIYDSLYEAELHQNINHKSDHEYLESLCCQKRGVAHDS